MAEFPAITPNERRYDLGAIPKSEFRGEGAVPVLFRTGTIAVGQKMQLPYINRPRSEIEAIWDHYHAQGNESFTLSAAVWCGHSGGDSIADPGLVWVYVNRSDIERESADRYSITVEIEAVGLLIGPTVAEASLSYGFGGTISGVVSPTLPSRPEPVPDPVPENPTVVNIPSPGLLLQTCSFVLGSQIEIRNGSYGLLETATLVLGNSLDIVYTPAP